MKVTQVTEVPIDAVVGRVMSVNERLMYFTRVLPDGSVIDVMPLTLGRARIIYSASIEAATWIDGW